MEDFKLTNCSMKINIDEKLFTGVFGLALENPSYNKRYVINEKSAFTIRILDKLTKNIFFVTRSPRWFSIKYYHNKQQIDRIVFGSKSISIDDAVFKMFCFSAVGLPQLSFNKLYSTNLDGVFIKEWASFKTPYFSIEKDKTFFNADDVFCKELIDNYKVV